MTRRAGSLSIRRLLLGCAVLTLVAGSAAPLAGAARSGPASAPASAPATPFGATGRAAEEVPALEDGSWVRLDAPTRLYDSRWLDEPLGASSVERLEIGELFAESGVDPAGLVLSVTVTGGTQASDLAVWPSGPRPRTSNLNWRPGETVANQVVVPVADGGFLVGNRAGTVHVIVDVMGYLGTAGADYSTRPTRYSPTTPTRALDTRAPGAPLDRFGPTEVGTLDLSGLSSMPADARGVVVNLTAVNASQTTDLALDRGPGWAINNPRRTSNLNVGPGQTRAVLAHVPLGPDGLISIRNQAGTVDVIVDVLGWYSPTGSTVHTTEPVRLFDTRSPTSPLTGPFLGGTPRTVDAGAIPDGATAAVVNLTVTAGTTAGDLRAWATGTPMPKVSNLNWPAGDTRPNLAIIPLDPQGRFQLRTSAGTTHVIADLVGWTAPPVPVLTPTITDLALPTGDRFDDIDCTSPTFCMAVGSGADGQAATWDGTTWTDRPFPENPLDGYRLYWQVDCGTPEACLVSTYLELGETIQIHRWDGTTFTHVGSFGCCENDQLALHWGCTASGWCYTTEGDPLDRANSGGGPQVYDCSGEDFCIGTSDVGETEPDQRLKQLVPGPSTVMPVDTSLDGWFPVDAWCSSSTACAAVDTAGTATWDGTTWTRAAPIPVAQAASWWDGWLSAWSCVDVDHCLYVVDLGNGAVGIGHTLVVLARSGDTWHELDLGAGSELVEPSCTPDGTCTVLFPLLDRAIQFEFPT